METTSQILGALEDVSARLSKLDIDQSGELLQERAKWIGLLAERRDIGEEHAPRLMRIAEEGDAFRERLLQMRNDLQAQTDDLARQSQWCEACEKTL
jgi:hypothetical protein